MANPALNLLDLNPGNPKKYIHNYRYDGRGRQQGADAEGGLLSLVLGSVEIINYVSIISTFLEALLWSYLAYKPHRHTLLAWPASAKSI